MIPFCFFSFVSFPHASKNPNSQIKVREMKLFAKLKCLNVIYRISYELSQMMPFFFFLPGICKFLARFKVLT